MAVKSKNLPAPDLVPVRRALISVSDKIGIVDFAAALSGRGIELVSTGGTASALKAAGLAVRDVSELTGFPEIMDGASRRCIPRSMAAFWRCATMTNTAPRIAAHCDQPIDLAVINLYPFEEVSASGADYAEAVENIDIGGPAMIRASAKNHAWVAIATDPADYREILDSNLTPMTVRRRFPCERPWPQGPLPAPPPTTPRSAGWFVTSARKSSAPRHFAIGGKLA